VVLVFLMDGASEKSPGVGELSCTHPGLIAREDEAQCAGVFRRRSIGERHRDDEIHAVDCRGSLEHDCVRTTLRTNSARPRSKYSSGPGRTSVSNLMCLCRWLTVDEAPMGGPSPTTAATSSIAMATRVLCMSPSLVSDPCGFRADSREAPHKWSSNRPHPRYTHRSRRLSCTHTSCHQWRASCESY
jgi:hypothetical protein